MQHHIIGHDIDKHGYLLDGHGAAIQGEIINLFKQVNKISKAKGVIIEWDKNFPEDFTDILSEIDKVKEAWGKKA